MTRRARVKVKSKPVTRAQAAAEFGRKKAKLRRKQWHRRVFMIAALVLASSALIGGWWLSHTGRLEKATESAEAHFWQWTADSGFRLTQVTLVGREHADSQAVKAALDIHPGAPTLGMNLAAMKARLEALPEVKAAMIARTLPGTLNVQIVERQPAAFWQNHEKLQLMDRDGVVLSRDKYPGKLSLPVVVGEDAPKHMPELMALLDTVPSLKADVAAAVRVGGRRWNITISRDIVVMLPEDDPAKAWKRFAELVATKALLSKAIRNVDMRLEDRVFITPIEEKDPGHSDQRT